MSRYKQFNDNDIPDDFVLPDGNIVRGQAIFKKHCSQCHTIRRDGANPYGTLWGPNLYGVMGRTAAKNQQTGGARYSTSLEDSGILWTDRNMMAFIKNPRGFAGGAINMNFRGIDSFRDRVDLVHYLKRAGHEEWMMQDGTPHSQKKWWTRGAGGAGGKTQSYWDINEDKKQVKPWQHVVRGASAKLEETKQRALKQIGWEAPLAAVEAQAEHRGGGAEEADSSADYIANDPEVLKWRRVQQVVEGVKPASVQKSFNWPPPEDISAGPQKRKKSPTKKSAAEDAAEAAAQLPATLTAALTGSEPGSWIAPSSMALCEESRPAPPAGGYRAPSGIMVYREPSGPAAIAAAPPPPPPPPQVRLGPPRPDGGRLAPSGLVVYAT